MKPVGDPHLPTVDEILEVSRRPTVSSPYGRSRASMLRISSMMLLLSVSIEWALSTIFGELCAGLARDVRGIDLDRRQALTELIVQLAREPLALLFLRLDTRRVRSRRCAAASSIAAAH